MDVEVVDNGIKVVDLYGKIEMVGGYSICVCVLELFDGLGFI